MATQDFWGTFRSWRRRRPFWGALFLLLSAFWFFFSANLSLGHLQVHIGPTGFLSYVIPVVMFICGVLCMFSPVQRIFYGIVSLLTALYSFIGLNLGGLFLGMLLGIIGGALVIAWGPPRVRPGTPAEQPGDTEPTPPEYAGPFAAPAEPNHDALTGHDAEGHTADDDEHTTPAGAETTQRIDVAGHDDRPSEEHESAGVVPGFDEEIPRQRGGGIARLGRNPKTMAIAIVPLALTAGILVASGRIPASADDCPKGLPSVSVPAAAKNKTTARKTTTAAAKPRTKSTAKPAPRTGAPAAGKSAAGASPSASDSEDASAHPVADALKNLAGGLGNLLGVGDDSSASPSTSPSPSTSGPATPAAGPSTPADPATTAPATGTTGPAKGATTEPAPAKTISASPKPGTSANTLLNCLGGRALGLKASPDDVPPVADEPGLMQTDLLVMTGFSYDGVATLTTGTGKSIRVLKFSMDSADNRPFTLSVPERTGKTVIKSPHLVVKDNVRFYTEKFAGKLLGIPLTFTPDSPPPLTLPIMAFTDVSINLNFIRCDTLTGTPLDLKPQS